MLRPHLATVRIAPHIRPGARVECPDGTLGTVQHAERDEDGAPKHIRVREQEGAKSVVVPIGLVREIGEDGAVWLEASTDQARSFTPRAQAAEGMRAMESPQPSAEATAPLPRGRIVATAEPRDLGEVVVGTEAREVRGRVEVETEREEVEVEHVPMDSVVEHRVLPWWEDGELIIPLYEERLRVTKRLVLKELLRIRRYVTVERHVYEDTRHQERSFVDDGGTGGLRETRSSRLGASLRELVRRAVERIRRWS